MKKSTKNLLLFWVIAIIFLSGWFWYWNTRYEGEKRFTKISGDYFGWMSELGDGKFGVAKDVVKYFLNDDGQEKTVMLLFQNNMELRPGGGFIGAFGVLKIKDKNVTSFEVHDTGVFDGRIPSTAEPPYPMGETLKIGSWKLRDSNFSPDFKVNANKAEEFYYMGDGQEKFDAVIGITTNVLTSFLEVTGPVSLAGYPGTYGSENAIMDLEYQVEKAYVEQGIEKGERKSVMNDLAKAIIERAYQLDNREKLKLLKIIIQDLDKKDIQVYFKDKELQKKMEKVNWSGTIDKTWPADYLMTVDANLGSYKSDYFVNRSLDYCVDLTKDEPEVNLKITYKHAAEKADWLTTNYLSYLRVYIPEEAWLKDYQNLSEVRFGKELGKKYLGTKIFVPVGETNTIEFNYFLPASIRNNYQLKIEKQAGLTDLPVKVTIKNKSGVVKVEEFKLSEANKTIDLLEMN